MRKIIVGAFLSLDGVMQAPGGPEEDPTGGFKYGGWTTPYWDEVMNETMGESMSKPFDLLLGRRTYDIFAAHWPFVETDPSAGAFDALNMQIAEKFNSLTKYVATHRPDSLTWRNSQSLGADVAATVRKLKAGDGPDLLTQGSTELVQILLENDLVDEMQLMMFPLVLGKGKRLFGKGAVPAAFSLTRSVVSTSGGFVGFYKRAGDIQTGSFAQEHPSEAELERRRTLR